MANHICLQNNLSKYKNPMLYFKLKRILLSFSKKKVLFSLAVVLFIVLVRTIHFNPILDKLELSELALSFSDKLINNVIIILAGIFLIKLLNLRDYAGLPRNKIHNVRFLLFPLFYLFIFTGGLVDFMNLSFDEIFSSIMFLFLLYNLSIGFLEEIIFRGLIQSNFIKHENRKNGIIYGVIFAAAIFGLVHFTSYLKGMASLENVLFQIFAAICIGTLFGAVLLKTGNILPIAFIHGLIDFFGGVRMVFPTAVSDAPQTKDFGDLVVSLLFMFLIMGSAFLIGLLILKGIIRNNENTNLQNGESV